MARNPGKLIRLAWGIVRTEGETKGAVVVCGDTGLCLLYSLRADAVACCPGCYSVRPVLIYEPATKRREKR